MAQKHIHIVNNQVMPATGGGGVNIDPALRDIVAGVEQLVAPDICIAVPKATGNPTVVTTTPLAVGAINFDVAGAGCNADIMCLRLPSMQRLLAAGSPTDTSVLQVVFFTVANGVNLGKGSTWADNADLTRTYTVQVAKVAGDGATTVVATRNFGGTAEPAPGTAVVAGQLNFLTGTGDATVAFSGRTYEKSAMVYGTTAITAAGVAFDPQLARLANYAPPPAFTTALAIPDICIPVPTVIQGAVTRQTFVSTVLATGAISCATGNIADNGAHATMFLRAHTLWRVIAALYGQSNDRRRYFTILNTASASVGAVYADNANPTATYTVQIAKVSGDGSLLLTAVRNLDGGLADAPTQNGQLNLVSGTGDATIAWASGDASVVQPMFEKYVDIRQNVAVAAGGTKFGFNLIENGAPVMPSIVIPIPKAINLVPFVSTDLTGAPGFVTVDINAPGGNCDIIALRLPSAWRP